MSQHLPFLRAQPLSLSLSCAHAVPTQPTTWSMSTTCTRHLGIRIRPFNRSRFGVMGIETACRCSYVAPLIPTLHPPLPRVLMDWPRAQHHVAHIIAARSIDYRCDIGAVADSRGIAMRAMCEEGLRERAGSGWLNLEAALAHLPLPLGDRFMLWPPCHGQFPACSTSPGALSGRSSPVAWPRTSGLAPMLGSRCSPA